MPKLYEYMGIIVLFYSNEHEPIHVHGKYQGRETRAELVIRDERVVDIIYSPMDHTENQMSLSDNAVIFVERAEHAGDLRLRITFNDATQPIVDFAPFLRQSHNPLIQAYLDPTAFARFTVHDGDLIWDDYDLCFPIADLYEGRV